MKEKMDFYEFQKTLRDDTQAWVGLANEHFDLSLSVKVAFDLRGTTAGTADSRNKIIRYNLGAYNVDGGIEHLINNTVPHEVAHIVQYNNPDWPQDRERNKPHGFYWKMVMDQFGVAADRCHSLPLKKSRQVKKYRYQCACRDDWQLTAYRHNKIRRDLRIYSCPNCKTRLTIKFT